MAGTRRIAIINTVIIAASGILVYFGLLLLFKEEFTIQFSKKAIGFFTKMVLGKNMSRIYTQARSDGHFWRNLVESQRQTRSRENGERGLF